MTIVIFVSVQSVMKKAYNEKVTGGAMSFSAASCVAALVVTYFFTPSIALLFISAEDGYVITLTHHFMMILTMAYPALLTIFLFRNGLQGMGFSNSAMLAGVAEMVARIAAAFTLVNLWGFTGVVCGHVLAWIMADAVLLPLYFAKTRGLERQQQLYQALDHN